MRRKKKDLAGGRESGRRRRYLLAAIDEAEMGLGFFGVRSGARVQARRVRVRACGGARMAGEDTSPAPGCFCRWKWRKNNGNA
jgi:hypothetical protein